MKTSFLVRAALALFVAAFHFAQSDCVLGGSGGDNERKGELKLFQGRWAPVYVEKDGKAIPKEGIEDLRALEAVVDGEKVVLKEDGKTKQDLDISFMIDPTKNPKTIDIFMGVKNAKQKFARGIYKLDGQTLIISIFEPSEEDARPTDFTTKEGSKNLLWHFKRK